VIAFSPDGELLAAGGEGGITIWNVHAQRQPRDLRHRRSACINALAFGSHGSVIATGDSNGSICLWELPSGNLQGTLVGSEAGEILSVAFSPEGSVLAAGDSDGIIRLWRTSSTQPAATMTPLSRREVFAIAFTHDSSVLATGSADGNIYLWDTDGAQLATLTRTHTGNLKVFATAFSPAESLQLAAGYNIGGIGVWDTERARLARTIGEAEPAVLAIAYSSDGRRLATGHARGDAKIWHVAPKRKSPVIISRDLSRID